MTIFSVSQDPLLYYLEKVFAWLMFSFTRNDITQSALNCRLVVNSVFTIISTISEIYRACHNIDKLEINGRK